ncbi:MAG: outer membrane beta-barrel protein [Alcanivoracaceae bacterium]
MKKLIWVPILITSLSLPFAAVFAQGNDRRSGAYESDDRRSGAYDSNERRARSNESSSKVYIGAGVGYYRINDSDFLDDNDRLKDNRTAWRLYGGFEASRALAIEAAYTDFGTSDDGAAKMKLSGVSAAVLLSLPIFQYIAPYGKIGMIAWDRTRTLGPIRNSDDGHDVFFGFGGRFALTPRSDLRLEYERYEVDNTDLDMVSANIQYRF